MRTASIIMLQQVVPLNLAKGSVIRYASYCCVCAQYEYNKWSFWQDMYPMPGSRALTLYGHVLTG